LLIEAALRSFSGKNQKPWEFVVVDDQAMLEKLSKSKPGGATFLRYAPLGIVVCADPEKAGTYIEDASIAAAMIHLMASDLGLGSCWIQIRNRTHQEGGSSEAYVADLLEIPKNYMIQAIIAIGYPAEPKVPHPKASLLFDKIHKGRFGTKMYRINE
jgi:nitroreductase